jgi:RNA polymerase sigma-70 factor (ECF subfamily)
MLSKIAATVDMRAEPGAHGSPGFLSWVATLVHAHRGRLLAYARRRGLDGEDSLDAVQDTFISFLTLPEARGIARDSEDSVRLLTVILRNNLQNRFRKRTRHGRAHLRLEAEGESTVAESSEDVIAHAEELARIQGCILRMAKLQRSVVMLSLLDELPREEVAEIVGISNGYARVLLHRARERIRTCSYVYDKEDADPETA